MFPKGVRVRLDPFGMDKRFVLVVPFAGRLVENVDSIVADGLAVAVGGVGRPCLPFSCRNDDIVVDDGTQLGRLALCAATDEDFRYQGRNHQAQHPVQAADRSHDSQRP